MSDRLQLLYECGVGFELVCDPEIGFSVALMDFEKEDEWVWDATYETFEIMEIALWEAAKRYYPKVKCFESKEPMYNN